MIGAVCHDDGVLARLGARGHHAYGGGVGAILGKQCPVGMGNLVDKSFCQVQHQWAGAGGTVDVGLLCSRGLVHLAVAIAQQVGAVTTHKVDVLVAVRIPQFRPFCPGKELGVLRGQRGGGLVAVNAGGEGCGGALAQFQVVVDPVHVNSSVQSCASSLLPAARSLRFSCCP